MTIDLENKLEQTSIRNMLFVQHGYANYGNTEESHVPCRNCHEACSHRCGTKSDHANSMQRRSRAFKLEISFVLSDIVSQREKLNRIFVRHCVVKLKLDGHDMKMDVVCIQ